MDVPEIPSKLAEIARKAGIDLGISSPYEKALQAAKEQCRFAWDCSEERVVALFEEFGFGGPIVDALTALVCDAFEAGYHAGQFDGFSREQQTNPGGEA